jgi:hypothetical protein
MSYDPSIAQADSRVGDRRQLRVVSDQHERSVTCAMDPLQDFHDVPSVGRVEIPGWFVGKYDRWIVGERAGQRYTLLLTAGQLGRIVMCPAC